MTETAQTVTARVDDVPPSALFAAVARPASHLAADGSGMLRALSEDTPDVIAAVGDTFGMEMTAEDGREYAVTNHVTAYEPDRRIAWMPAGRGRDPIGVEWSWTFEPAPAGGIDSGGGGSETGTVVAVTCDWSRVTDEAYLAKFTLPRVSAEKVRGTVAAMARLAADA